MLKEDFFQFNLSERKFRRLMRFILPWVFQGLLKTSLVFAEEVVPLEKPNEILLQSSYDTFQISLEKDHYNLEGKTISLGTLEQFFTLFSTTFEDPCPKEKPDLTLTAKWKKQNQTKVLKIFIDQRRIQNGNECAAATGEGIYFLPLHRSWFQVDEKRTIPLLSPLKIVKDNETLAQFEMVKGLWQQTSSKEYINWDFFDQFKASLKDFEVTSRAHPNVSKGKSSFTLYSGTIKYDFFQISDSLWAVRLPKVKWLVGSSRWSVWLEMQKEQWMDRLSSQLNFITDKGKQLSDRIGTLNSLSEQWSPSLQQVLKQILFDKSESDEIKIQAVHLMRQKPTMENMGILIKTMEQTQNQELLKPIFKALRIMNPNGPLLEEDMTQQQIDERVHVWKKWWIEKEKSEVNHSQINSEVKIKN
ncbi:MAG: hypothetical protein K1X29_10065 [Bdellovibrionales bacterium]|nr:hypothetical protein [Bdellovibrionales bacterium]